MLTRKNSERCGDLLKGHVIIVSSEFPPGPGGIGTHAHQLASGLQRLGWRALVLTSQDYASEAEVSAFNRAQPFPIVRLRPIPGAPFEAVYREAVLARFIDQHAPEVLIATGSRAVMLAAARFTGRRIPWVAVGHGTEFGSSRGWQAAAARFAFRRATAVVCVSEYTRKQMHAAGIRPAMELVIPNGADPARFKVVPRADSAALRRKLKLPEGPLLVTVGNVTERKGQDIVVRALPEILRSFPTVHYAMVGLPTLGEEIRRLAADVGVADHVHLLGRLDDELLVSLLNAADIFLMTSRRTADGDFEGYGIAVVEAALCGCPAVVSADSGLAEAVKDGETGICVPPNDPAATARTVTGLLEDDALRRRMGQAAQRRAEREQTWAHRVADYESFLRQVVRSRGRVLSAGSPASSSSP